jgi:hypothetical protein
MPKELVFSDQLPYGEDDPRVTVAEVSWSREAEHVQLVTKSIDRATHEPVETTSDLPVTAGFYMQLNRREINQLIRNLRKARDQAFGKDE